MMRSLLVSAALVFAARSSSAQAPFAAAKKAAQNAAAATNAHTDAMQKPEAQSQPKASATVAKVNAPAAKPAAKTTASAPAPKTTASAPAPKPQGKAQQPAGTQTPGAELTVATTDTLSPPPSIMREVFEYAKEGRRDPFVSLLTTSELRPTMSDLRLTTILVDLGGRNSVAILRDMVANTQYRVHVGSTLGRMRVSSIRGNVVLLTIDEFGTTRQDSLVLRDSTKVRRP